MPISAYSTTASSNTSISGIDIAENCPPASLNNAIRQMMADIASAQASDSQMGFVELATSAEVATGTDTVRAVTPAGLVSRQASSTQTGLVELATSAEVVTGTDTARAVTPAGLANVLVSYSPFRNRIVNGSMQIDQRHNGAAHACNVGAGGWVADRWFVWPVGGNVTAQRLFASSGKPYAEILGAAGVTNIYHTHWIESALVRDLAGTTATLSVQLSDSLLTTVSWEASYANALNDFTGETVFASGTFTVGYTLDKKSVQIALPANAKNGVKIALNVGAQTSGFFHFTDVQLEAGSVASTFEVVPPATELLRCYRDYYRGKFVYDCYQAAGSNASLTMNLPVEPRVTPTLTVTADGSNVNHGTLVIAAATPTGASVPNAVIAYATTTATGFVRLEGTYTVSTGY